MLEQGERIVQQTRSFDASNDTTFSIRDKEEANDYRYFPEPDLSPFLLSRIVHSKYKRTATCVAIRADGKIQRVWVKRI